MGSFTTFSTFAVDNVLLVDHGAFGTAIAYVGSTLILGVAAGWLGVRLGRTIVSASAR
jgi:CrcB protein